MNKAKDIRELFKKYGIIYIVGAHDGLSAKLVERNGFDGVWASGLEISTSYCVPDADILTMSQYLERACEMNDAVSIPVIADCDTGYGNSNNVIHMVRKYEAAGIAAVCIEDKKFPKVNSLLANGRQELAPIAEFVGKIMAAKNTQVSKDFMVIARTEALIAGWGIEEAIKRADAYAEAGADALLIHSKSKDAREIIQFCKRWKHKIPIVIVPTNYPDIAEADIKKAGIKMVIYANHGMRSAIKAMDDVLARIKKDKGIHNISDMIVPMADVFDLQGMKRMQEQEKAYLKTETGGISAVILAAGRPTVQNDLAAILEDMPVAMLDMNGKSILERTVDTLRRASINNINVVVGYQKDKIKAEGVNIIENNKFENTGVLESFMKAAPVFNNRTILCYGDIIFNDAILDQLLKKDSDITMVVDPSFKKTNIRNKKLDLVRTKRKPFIGKRSIPYESNPIIEIGRDIPENKADYEFIGLALFSKKGIRDFTKEYDNLRKPASNKGSGRFMNMDIVDVLNGMIKKGYVVDSMELHSGWIEIHTFNNYKTACNIIK